MAPIDILIITSKQLLLCQHDCGTDWSQAEIQKEARKEISKRFGNSVRVDFKQSDNGDRQIKNENEYSLLLINGQTILAGQFDIRQVIDIVETQMEIGAPVQ